MCHRQDSERRRAVTRLVIPFMQGVQDEPFVPDVQMIYWVDTQLLPSDPEPERPVVVMVAPATTFGTVIVATRSSSEEFGVFHDAAPALGLNKLGWFSRRVAVQCQLWTPQLVHSVGKLDDETFAYVLGRFSP